MAGVMLEAAAAGVCAVSDGFISGAAALVATRLCPDAAGYLFPSHRSVEPGHSIVLTASVPSRSWSSTCASVRVRRRSGDSDHGRCV